MNEWIFAEDWLGALIRIVISLTIMLGVFVYLSVWAERKVSAFMQDRIGPNRVGPFGIFQNVADAIKAIFKEDIRPRTANPILYRLGPWLAVFPAFLAFATVPLGVHRMDGELVPFMIANLDVGVLFTLSVASLGVFSLILGGWSAGSKYPLMGALRAAAQMISYEIPLGLAILSVVVLTGTTRLNDIVAMQSNSWLVMWLPIGCILFGVSMFAETNRLPFDLPEGEAEIIGYHAEYSGMKFVMFMMAEYCNMFTASCLIVSLFFGGWQFLPFLSWDRIETLTGVDLLGHPVLWLLPTVWFLTKVAFFLFVFIWVRWTIPRFRYDQLMRLGWQRLIPLGFFNLLAAVAVAPRYFL